MSQQIILILPYFGKLPNTFDFFLQSCKNNPSIDWLIFTDCDIKEYSNIKVIRQSWDDFRKFVQAKFDFPIALNSPYKLCDFRPAYGYIFQEFITSYGYWGHCDCDLIWGDLSLLHDLAAKEYERIGIWGHLSIYKNSSEINTWFKTLRSTEVPSYKTIYSNSQNFSFDEFAGMNKLLSTNKKAVNEDRFFDDIIFYTSNFFTRRPYKNIPTTHSTPCYFIYEKGKLHRKLYLNKHWVEDESLYVHLQKRKIKIQTSNLNFYTIVPDSFIDTGILSEKELYKRSKAPFCDFRYHKMMIKYQISNWIKNLLK